MNVEQMIEKKKELGFSNEMIAKLSKIPLSTVQKIFSGETKSPRYDTVTAISRVLERGLDNFKYDYPNELHEGPAYNVNTSAKGSKDSKQTNKVKIFEDTLIDTSRHKPDYANRTLDDYMSLPEGARIEMIDGQFYDMAAPTTIHQRIASILFYMFERHIEKNKGGCIPFIAPTDVQIDCDDKTMVQPDVFIVCDKSKITRARIVGAPDLIVEVLSPSNFLMDLVIKLTKYRTAGVREYWVVVPEERVVIVYNFEKSGDPVNYTFDDLVPVGIWNDKCKIDFKEINAKIGALFE